MAGKERDDGLAAVQASNGGILGGLELLLEPEKRGAEGSHGGDAGGVAVITLAHLTNH